MAARDIHGLDFLLYSSLHHLLHSEDMDIQNTPSIARNYQDSPVAQLVKNLPAMQENWVQFLGQEDRLEDKTATHSSLLAWENPHGQRSLGATVHGTAKSGTRLNDEWFR